MGIKEAVWYKKHYTWLLGKSRTTLTLDVYNFSMENLRPLIQTVGEFTANLPKIANYSKSYLDGHFDSSNNGWKYLLERLENGKKPKFPQSPPVQPNAEEFTPIRENRADPAGFYGGGYCNLCGIDRLEIGPRPDRREIPRLASWPTIDPRSVGNWLMSAFWQKRQRKLQPAVAIE